jgi:hypothetical protein
MNNRVFQRISRSRRTRGILAAAGLILAGAVITATIMSGLGFSLRPSFGLFESAGGPCTLSGTTTARGGTITVCARYSISAAGQVRIRSVRASYSSANGYAIPRFIVTLTNEATGILDERLSGPVDDADAIQSYSAQFTAFRGPGAHGSFALGETMVVTLTATDYGAGRPYKLTLASVPLVLSRGAFRCPDPGTSGYGNSNVPTC